MSFEDDLDLFELAIWLGILGAIVYVVWKYLIPLFQSGTSAGAAITGAGVDISSSLLKLQNWANGLGATATPATPPTTSQTGATIPAMDPNTYGGPVSAAGSPPGGGCAVGNPGVCCNGYCS